MEVLEPEATRLGTRPAWHRLAACRADDPGMWTIERGDKHLADCRRTCQQCPVAGDCLREGVAEPPAQRQHGPMRVGLSGAKTWRAVHKLVELLDPETEDDWEQLAAMLLDERREVLEVVA